MLLCKNPARGGAGFRVLGPKRACSDSEEVGTFGFGLGPQGIEGSRIKGKTTGEARRAAELLAHHPLGGSLLAVPGLQ